MSAVCGYVMSIQVCGVCMHAESDFVMFVHLAPVSGKTSIAFS